MLDVVRNEIHAFIIVNNLSWCILYIYVSFTSCFVLIINHSGRSDGKKKPEVLILESSSQLGELTKIVPSYEIIKEQTHLDIVFIPNISQY